mmetsp:Transcript_7510/g.29641  ORF Transcript_7510/g.29641 Transcript_7510/m.29641 type:complete len:303 (+) Transcript_7510:353-1261(+)
MSALGSVAHSANTCLSTGPTRLASLRKSLHAELRIWSFVTSVSRAKFRSDRFKTENESSKNFSRCSASAFAAFAASSRFFSSFSAFFAAFFAAFSSMTATAPAPASASSGSPAAAGCVGEEVGESSPSPPAAASMSASMAASPRSSPSEFVPTGESRREDSSMDTCVATNPEGPCGGLGSAVRSEARSEGAAGKAASETDAFSPKMYSSPPASQATALLAAGAASISSLRTRRMTITACSFGFCWTSARMTTTASPATSSLGWSDSSRRDLMHTAAIWGMIAAHLPMARMVRATNSLLVLLR